MEGLIAKRKAGSQRGFHLDHLQLLRLTTVADEPSRLKFDVLHYNITIEPDIPSKTLSGSVVIRFASNTANLTQAEFDCGNLEIETVKQADIPRQFSVKDHRLAVTIPE